MTAAMATAQHKEQKPAQRQCEDADEPRQVDVDSMNLIVPGLIERVEV